MQAYKCKGTDGSVFPLLVVSCKHLTTPADVTEAVKQTTQCSWNSKHYHVPINAYQVLERALEINAQLLPGRYSEMFGAPCSFFVNLLPHHHVTMILTGMEMCSECGKPSQLRCLRCYRTSNSTSQELHRLIAVLIIGREDPVWRRYAFSTVRTS